MNPPSKFFLVSIAVGLLVQCSLLAKDNPQIQEIELDEHSVVTVPVSPTRVTTISFPGPISAIDAASVTTDGKTAGLFQLAHKPGSYFFSVRSLAKGAITNVNIRWNNKTYVLELQDSQVPVLSLNFKPIDNHPSSSFHRPVTPGVLLGLLDKAKAYPLLKTSHPEAVEQADYANYSEQPRVMDYQNFEVRLEEVFRFEPQDTLVFRVILRNKKEQEIRYRADGFSIRAGDRIYPQSISDSSGVMPPKSDSLAYFAITGTPDGGRNELSLKNEFSVLLSTLDAEMTKAVDSVPLNGGFSK